MKGYVVEYFLTGSSLYNYVILIKKYHILINPFYFCFLYHTHTHTHTCVHKLIHLSPWL